MGLFCANKIPGAVPCPEKDRLRGTDYIGNKAVADIHGKGEENINGAANTGRKYDERIFPEGQDYSCLCGTVKAMRYKGILEESHRYHRQEAS